MQHYLLRRAVLAARAAPREEPKVMTAPEPRCKMGSPPPAKRDWLVVSQEPAQQHDAHVATYYKLALAGWKPRPRPFFEVIREAVCDQFGVSILEIMSRRRKQSISRARMVCMYLAMKHTSYSLPEIGRKAGRFHHNTVIHAVKRIDDLRVVDPMMDAAIHEIESRLERAP